MPFTLLIVGILLYGLAGGVASRRSYAAIAFFGALATVWMLR
jgi:hypothetical protein